MGYENRRSGIPYGIVQAAVPTSGWTKVAFPGQSIEVQVHCPAQGMKVSFDGGASFVTLQAHEQMAFHVRCTAVWLQSVTSAADAEVLVSHEGPGSL